VASTRCGLQSGFDNTTFGTDEQVAVKMIDKVETSLPKIKREVEMLEALAHPHNVKLHDVFYEKIFVCLVMDLFTGGTMIQGMQAFHFAIQIWSHAVGASKALTNLGVNGKRMREDHRGCSASSSCYCARD
jgi:serine/threonine protein kinase